MKLWCQIGKSGEKKRGAKEGRGKFSRAIYEIFSKRIMDSRKLYVGWFKIIHHVKSFSLFLIQG